MNSAAAFRVCASAPQRTDGSPERTGCRTCCAHQKRSQYGSAPTNSNRTPFFTKNKQVSFETHHQLSLSLSLSARDEFFGHPTRSMRFARENRERGRARKARRSLETKRSGGSTRCVQRTERLEAAGAHGRSGDAPARVGGDGLGDLCALGLALDILHLVHHHLRTPKLSYVDFRVS